MSLIRTAEYILLLIGALLLAGCQTASTPSAGVVRTTSTDANSGAGTILTQPVMPGVFIQNATSKAIFDAVIRERAPKKMTIKKREAYVLKMALRVPKADKPTEAQIVYTVNRYKNGLWLSSNVYQVVNPNTPEEDILDVTGRVEAEMQAELDRVARRLKSK